MVRDYFQKICNIPIQILNELYSTYLLADTGPHILRLLTRKYLTFFSVSFRLMNSFQSSFPEVHYFPVFHFPFIHSKAYSLLIFILHRQQQHQGWPLVHFGTFFSQVMFNDRGAKMQMGLDAVNSQNLIQFNSNLFSFFLFFSLANASYIG